MAVGTIAAIAMGVKGVMDLTSGINQANAQEEQSQFQAQQDRFNAQIMDLQAEDALNRGEQDASKLMQQASGLKGSQKASAVGQGVDVSSGTAASLVAETDKLSKLDVLTIKSNAAREAFGYKTQAFGARMQARATEEAGKNASRSTLLTAGANAVGSAIGGYNSLQDAKYRASTTGKTS